MMDRWRPAIRQRRTIWLQPNKATPLEWTAATPCAVENVEARSFSPWMKKPELLGGELSATLCRRGGSTERHGLPSEQASVRLAFFSGAELDETTVRRHT